MTPENDLQAILRGALRAADPAPAVAEALADDPWTERVAHRLAGGGRGARLIAVGKAAVRMTEGALWVLGDAVADGVVLVPEGAHHERPDVLPSCLEFRSGGHPVPTPEGEASAQRVAELVRTCGPGDPLLVLLSGGGSSLLALPAGRLTLDDLAETGRVLLAAGLPIEELNLVRRHLELLKGGGLARLAAAADVRGLVLSDVPGDDPAVVASGPLTAVGTSRADAARRLRDRGLWTAVPAAVRAHLETPVRGVPPAERSGLDAPVVVAGGGRALDGAAAQARERGYTVHVLTQTLRGEARVAGRGLARVGLAVRDGLGPVRAPACLLAAGETTVRVLGRGLGGRNQELALAAAIALEGERGVTVASLGTDGQDGPTDAAGGWADGETVARGRAAGLDPDRALAENDSYAFLAASGGLLRTGPTGTNVADVMVVLVRLS